jgi:hypothetical protein
MGLRKLLRSAAPTCSEVSVSNLHLVAPTNVTLDPARPETQEKKSWQFSLSPAGIIIKIKLFPAKESLASDKNWLVT